ncbi:MAG: YdiU family protein [Kangiellaceae bacterium]|jgi:uncharacterized protein YdiU (UPF0061 family)|nr:YdiU family protein [Kangiellaceae bacterium]
MLSSFSNNLSSAFTSRLPGDETANSTPRQTPNVCWAACQPSQVPEPRIVGYFKEVADLIGLPGDPAAHSELTDWLSGNLTLDNSQPYSACYGGHQFGHWAGQLGDGRAITIAEINYQQQNWDIQLKGAGLTPYSRTADGKAVLRSSIREFLCSEAMAHLGIPTTRALSLVLTGEPVLRDILYNGDVKAEPGAIVCRVAPSFIRFGNFEILAARQEHALLNQLIDFTIGRDFPWLEGTRDQKIAAWFSEVCQRTANMIVEWQRVGFVHGVMNTDNMSILGLTIDYGPYGWLDNYDPNWTPNTTDAERRRYRFENQPAVARWNLACLANALASVVDDHEVFHVGIGVYDLTLSEKLYQMQCNKLGLSLESECLSQNQTLIKQTWQLLEQLQLDYTLFFRQLTESSAANLTLSQLLNTSYLADLNEQQHTFAEQWLANYQAHVEQQLSANLNQPKKRSDAMQQSNPQFILRNYLSQQAIEAAEQNDYSKLEELMQLLKSPYKVTDRSQHYLAKRPEWALNKVGCSMLSCSS